MDRKLEASNTNREEKYESSSQNIPFRRADSISRICPGRLV